ncbi:hypothetical protein SCHPADRAFT_536514 [Schizopora paradoxa]|uniref:Uncharacterized protein n=1 Tax=Schizopora paradoxa TaxID=27342 RepID=A0A0H2RKR4_9AGAM|nr:hypothetical protein SCHPADRAFT_536514 [Schizopora paradoxa]
MSACISSLPGISQEELDEAIEILEVILLRETGGALQVVLREPDASNDASGARSRLSQTADTIKRLVESLKTVRDGSRAALSESFTPSQKRKSVNLPTLSFRDRITYHRQLLTPSATPSPAQFTFPSVLLPYPTPSPSPPKRRVDDSENDDDNSPHITKRARNLSEDEGESVDMDVENEESGRVAGSNGLDDRDALFSPHQSPPLSPGGASVEDANSDGIESVDSTNHPPALRDEMTLGRVPDEHSNRDRDVALYAAPFADANEVPPGEPITDDDGVEDNINDHIPHNEAPLDDNANNDEMEDAGSDGEPELGDGPPVEDMINRHHLENIANLPDRNCKRNAKKAPRTSKKKKSRASKKAKAASYVPSGKGERVQETVGAVELLASFCCGITTPGIRDGMRTILDAIRGGDFEEEVAGLLHQNDLFSITARIGRMEKNSAVFRFSLLLNQMQLSLKITSIQKSVRSIYEAYAKEAKEAGHTPMSRSGFFKHHNMGERVMCLVASGGLHMVTILACLPDTLQKLSKYSCGDDSLIRMANLIRNPPTDSPSRRLIIDHLIPELVYVGDQFDFYIPTQHQGSFKDYAWPASVRSLDLDGSDCFFEKMPKNTEIVGRAEIWDDLRGAYTSKPDKTACHATHSLLARTMALPTLSTHPYPQDAPSPMSVHEDVDDSDSEISSSEDEEDEGEVFSLEVVAKQPCPFTGDNAREWTKTQQVLCLEDIKSRRAQSVGSLRELVSIYM